MSTMKFAPLLFLVVALFGAGDCRIGDSCTPGLNDDCYYKKPYGELYCNFKHEKCERRYRGCTIGTQRSVCSSLEAATRIAESVCGFWKTSDKKRFDDCVAGNAIVDEAQKAACKEALTQICNKDSCPQNFFDPLCKLSNV